MSARALSAAQLAQRRIAPVKHRAYARSDEARRLPDHRVKYQRRKVRRAFPHLTPADAVLVDARVFQAIVVRDMVDEMNAYRRRCEPIPRRLREDFQRATARLVAYDAELRARDEEHARRADPGAFLSALSPSEDGGRP